MLKSLLIRNCDWGEFHSDRAEIRFAESHSGDLETVTAFDAALISGFSFGAAIAEGECEQPVYFVIKRESQRCNNRPRAETRGGFI
jgi:hypothetical protein